MKQHLLIILLILFLPTACQITTEQAVLPATATVSWAALPNPTATIAPPTVMVTASPTPTNTPSPTIPHTPFPTPTSTPMPETGYYGNPSIGFGFYYPSEWETEEIADGLRVVNKDIGLIVFGGSNLLDADQTLESYISDNFYSAIGSDDTVTVFTQTTTTLQDGTSAEVIEFGSTVSQIRARSTMVTRGRRLFMVLTLAENWVFDKYPRTVEAIATSMEVHEPRPYGISADSALFLHAGEPETLDPATDEGSAGGMVGALFSGLVTLDENLQVVPDLAERWEVNEAGTIYTFYLRDNATFHDGRLVTANDVKYSWERATDPETKSNTAKTYLGDVAGVTEKLAGDVDTISGVTVIDDDTLQVTITDPKAYFLAKLTYPTSFVVDEATINIINWKEHLNGTGPFKIDTWEDEQVIILKRNDNFYLEPAQIEYIVLRLDNTVSMWLYENEEIDITGVSSLHLDRVTDPANSLQAELTISPRLCTTRLALDSTLPPFDDPLVRQAFAHAVDREQLVEVISQGMAVPAYSILPPGMPGYDESIQAPTFDPAKAKTLLEESSYGSAEALPDIVFTISGLGNDLGDQTSALLEMWRTNLGVEVTVQQLDPAEYFDLIRVEHYQIIRTGWCADYPDPENFLDILYHSESDFNYTNYNNSQIDALLEQARIEQDFQKRFELYHQIEQMIIEDSNNILLHHSLSYTLIKPHINNYHISPIGGQALTWRQVSINKKGVNDE